MTQNLTINDLNKYISSIFELENKLINRDIQITLLKFEVEINKQLLESFKRYYVKGESTCK